MKVLLADSCSNGNNADSNAPIFVSEWMRQRNLDEHSICCFQLKPPQVHVKKIMATRKTIYECISIRETRGDWFSSVSGRLGNCTYTVNTVPMLGIDFLRLDIVRSFCLNFINIFAPHLMTRSHVDDSDQQKFIREINIFIVAKQASKNVLSQLKRSTSPENQLIITVAPPIYTEAVQDKENLLCTVKQALEECKKEEMPDKQLESLTDAIIKLELIRTSLNKPVSFQWVDSCSKSEACFIMYNASRMKCVLNEFEKKINDGVYGSLPPLDELHLDQMTYEPEWIVVKSLLEFLPIINRLANFLAMSDSETFFTLHSLYIFISNLTRCFSSYYNKNKILMDPKNETVLQYTYLRIHVTKAVYSIVSLCLRLIDCKPLDRM